MRLSIAMRIAVYGGLALVIAAISIYFSNPEHSIALGLLEPATAASYEAPRWREDEVESDFKPVAVLPPLPAITKFPIAKAEEANRKLDDAELVLGVEVNGAARAYPINMLTGPQREILNDRLGGRAIAATW